MFVAETNSLLQFKFKTYYFGGVCLFFLVLSYRFVDAHSSSAVDLAFLPDL